MIPAILAQACDAIERALRVQPTLYADALPDILHVLHEMEALRHALDDTLTPEKETVSPLIAQVNAGAELELGVSGDEPARNGIPQCYWCERPIPTPQDAYVDAMLTWVFGYFYCSEMCRDAHVESQ